MSFSVTITVGQSLMQLFSSLLFENDRLFQKTSLQLSIDIANLLANSVLNGLSVKQIYKIVFLKNTRLLPLVKITINVSNFLNRYRTIVFFQKEKNLSGLLHKKNCQAAKPHVPSRFLKQFKSFCERLR